MSYLGCVLSIIGIWMTADSWVFGSLVSAPVAVAQRGCTTVRQHRYDGRFCYATDDGVALLPNPRGRRG